MKSELQGLLDRVNKKTDVKFVDKEIYDTLQKKFGYNDFRPHQRKIINTIRLKKNILVKLPTGHGKSLCYQLPAIISEGITIVVSPLIALMKDQIDQLKLKGIKNAAFINSTLSSDEQHFVMKKVQTGQIKILYISPERFRSRLFISQLSHQLISIFVIDEAHCISQWGHDFRPDYLSLNSVINKLDPESLALFTATVPPEIEKDIVKQLNLYHFEKIAASSFRANLRYSVLKCADKEEKLKILTCYFNQSGGKGIIYVGRRSDAEFINHYLQNIGKKSDFYHAGRNKKERNQVQKKFFKEEGSSIDIVVATNAFGLGINKRNVRFVIHFAPPGSPEAYYQESGRAGRDGYPADCILLYSDDDWKLQKWFIKNSIIKKTELEILYSTLGTWHGYGQFRWIKVSELRRVTRLKESKIKQCLSYLHRIQFLKQHPNISSTLQLNYWFNSPLEIADKINLPFIEEKIDTLIYCREYHVSPSDLMEKLYDASWNKYLSFYGQEDCLLIECIAPLSELNLITEDQIGINDYIQAKEKQLEKMMLYAFSKVCKQKYLCNYLDRRIPFAHNCGTCQICSPDSQIKITTTDYDDMVTNFINKRDDAVIRQHKDVSDINAKASNYSPYIKPISSSNENECHILKKIVCLANSRKYSGWCFAGKIIQNGKLSEWIRPVSDREMGQLSTEDIKLQNGAIPKLLDVITVPLIRPSSHSFQPENYQIDSKYKWHRDTVYTECLIPSLCDPIEELWENKSRSSKGINDRIEFETAKNHINFSIVSIQANNLTIIVGYEIGKKKSIRAKFVFNNTMYCLAVTDPLIEHNYLFLDAGEYLLNGIFLLTISLGEPFKGYCYKLVAGIIGPITL